MFIRYTRRALLALAITLTAGAGLAYEAAGASAQTVDEATSGNWAGYIAKTTSRDSFSTVSGSWTQPAATSSSSATSGYSAFWVGLGGSSGDSQSLEQIGTSSDWVDGHAEYYAWYELLPAAEVKLDMAINAGDRIAASVNVSGTTVTMHLIDETTGASVTKTESMSNPDTSSAEWIAEAPAGGSDSGNYQTLPLANFGKVTFTSASATADGHTGSISDSDWAVQQVNLGSTAGSATGYPAQAGIGPGDAVDTSGSAGATTSSLSSDGASFSVSVDSSTGAAGGSVGDPQPGYDGGGYGAAYGDGSGPGGYGGYGYGYGGYGYGGG
jgi:Peptidase A4 family